MKLILASASPRRAEILRNAGFGFETRTTQLDESRLAGELPGDYVRRLALAKARAVARDPNVSEQAAYVIGADTAVVIGQEVFGKPESIEEARWMLRRLSGVAHEVHTGLAVLRLPGQVERVIEEITRVHFAPLADDEIESYLATGEPFDKAGAYGIQGIGGRFIPRIEGCYFNVMGLPLAQLYSLLRELGWKESHGNGMEA